MCRLFIEGDPALWERHTRSLRLHGLATSLRLETFFWNILAEIARRDGLTLSQLVAKLYDELVEARGETGNFASFLRVLLRPLSSAAGPWRSTCRSLNPNP